MSSTQPDVIRVAHSPDSDDAFMFYGLAADKVDTEGLTFTHELVDIETLNNEAKKGTYELTAISYHAYAYVHDKYAILTVGSSIGNKYGPIVVAKEAWTKEQLKTKTIAIPGEMTSAYLALKIWEPELKTITVPFDQIMEGVAEGKYDAGLIIHEGQLTYPSLGLKKIVDLGEWWFEDTNLTLPLGGNAIRRDLGPELIQKIARVLKRSIEYGLNHREDALDHCMKYARGLTKEQTDKFVGMYVNEMTMDADEEIQKAVKLLLWRGNGIGVVPEKIVPEFIGIELIETEAPTAAAV
jgi:1,4-dihydroxy-6-naphthoate synthase